ncbi:unnamed protein product, partial [Brenthis ino]
MKRIGACDPLGRWTEWSAHTNSWSFEEHSNSKQARLTGDIHWSTENGVSDDALEGSFSGGRSVVVAGLNRAAAAHAGSDPVPRFVSRCPLRG